MMRSHLLRLAIVLAAIAPACDKTPGAPPMAGTATLSVTSPHEDDGALLITLRGPGLTSVQAASTEYRVYWRLVSQDEVRIMVLGDVESGPVVTAQLAAVNRLDEYSAAVEQVATRGDMLRVELDGYHLALTAQQ